jgi:hypothetical protein
MLAHVPSARFSKVTTLIVGLLMWCGVVGGSARAQLSGQVIWETGGPVATSSGMTAVVADPDLPKVAWIASATSVWVTDDEGQSFSLVLQLSRSSGLVRSGEDEDEEKDSDEEAPAEDGPTEEELEDDPTLDVDSESGSNAANDDESAGGGTDEGGVEARYGVVRMRVIGDRVYICTSRGLYAVARDARRIGTGREIRFGRRVAVNDIAQTPDGRLWVATDLGVVVIGDDGLARPARGLEEDLVVRAVVVAEGRVVLATSRGLRLGSKAFDGFDRFALGSREDSGLEDVLVEPEGRLLVAGGEQVARILAKPGEVPVVEEISQVPGASRLALGREGSRWAVGRRGAWRWHKDDGWQRQSEGLFDRRLLDVAPGFGGVSLLWAAGRAGAFRLVSESGRAMAAAAERLAREVLERYPSDAEVLGWAIDGRGAKLGDVDDLSHQRRLSWLLPKVTMRMTWNRLRDEDYLFVAGLGRRVLDQVDVTPEDDALVVLAMWDIMPALTVAVDGSEPVLEATRIRARQELERVREVIMPLYQAWAKKKVDLVARESGNLKAMVKEMLGVQQLEADLHVYTHGRFPVGRDDSRRTR